MDHPLQLWQPPSTAPEGQEEGLSPALVMAPLPGRCGAINSSGR